MDILVPDTPFVRALYDVIAQVDSVIPEGFTGTVDAYLLGGAAIHIYTRWRVSDDIDLKLSHRVLLPRIPAALFIDNDGRERGVRLDTAFTDVLALLPPDWEKDCRRVDRIGRIDLRIISPVDLAVSKIGRFQGNDVEDIEQLARHGLLHPESLERRCREALDYFIGGTTMIPYNLRDALEIVRTCSPSSTTTRP